MDGRCELRGFESIQSPSRNRDQVASLRGAREFAGREMRTPSQYGRGSANTLYGTTLELYAPGTRLRLVHTADKPRTLTGLERETGGAFPFT